MKLTDRHKAIIEIVKSFEPITSDEIGREAFFREIYIKKWFGCFGNARSTRG